MNRSENYYWFHLKTSGPWISTSQITLVFFLLTWVRENHEQREKKIFEKTPAYYITYHLWWAISRAIKAEVVPRVHLQIVVDSFPFTKTVCSTLHVKMNLEMNMFSFAFHLSSFPKICLILQPIRLLFVCRTTFTNYNPIFFTLFIHVVVRLP